jgi:hypothetical protein
VLLNRSSVTGGGGVVVSASGNGGSGTAGGVVGTVAGKFGAGSSTGRSTCACSGSVVVFDSTGAVLGFEAGVGSDVLLFVVLLGAALLPHPPQPLTTVPHDPQPSSTMT